MTTIVGMGMKVIDLYLFAFAVFDAQPTDTRINKVNLVGHVIYQGFGLRLFGHIFAAGIWLGKAT